MKSSLVGNCIDSCSQRALQVPAPGGVSRWGLAVGAVAPAFILRRATDRTPHGLPGTLHLLASPATCHCFNPEFSLIHFPPAQKIVLNLYSAGSKTPTSRGGNERLLAALPPRKASRMGRGNEIVCGSWVKLITMKISLPWPERRHTSTPSGTVPRAGFTWLT
jgi:hypothetical protein